MEKITKRVMEEYEIIRQSGVTNMFDYYNVIRIAGKVGASELAKVTLQDYKYLLMNFGRLMKEYNIKQN